MVYDIARSRDAHDEKERLQDAVHSLKRTFFAEPPNFNYIVYYPKTKDCCSILIEQTVKQHFAKRLAELPSQASREPQLRLSRHDP
jgi:hypothetical protein